MKLYDYLLMKTRQLRLESRTVEISCSFFRNLILDSLIVNEEKEPASISFDVIASFKIR